MSRMSAARAEWLQLAGVKGWLPSIWPKGFGAKSGKPINAAFIGRLLDDRFVEMRVLRGERHYFITFAGSKAMRRYADNLLVRA